MCELVGIVMGHNFASWEGLEIAMSPSLVWAKATNQPITTELVMTVIGERATDVMMIENYKRIFSDEDLHVVWVPKGVRFQIETDDYKDYIVLQDDDLWVTA